MHTIVIHERLKELRNANNCTQKAIAEAINIPVKNYQSYEYNLCQPPLEILFALKDLYSFGSIDELLGIVKINAGNPFIEKYRTLSLEKKKIVDFILGEQTTSTSNQV